MLNALAVAALLAVLPLGVPQIAATVADAAHAALAAVIAHDSMGCPPDDVRKSIGAAPVERLGRLDGDDVVLARVGSPCMCGATGNCPVYVVRVTPGHPRALLSTYGSTIEMRPASPLPRIVILSHDSAAVAGESTYAYRNGAYETTSEMRLRWRDKARKPVQPVPVHFAVNASSAELHGRVSLGWDDGYAFVANAGQQLVIDGLHSPGRITLSLHRANDAAVTVTPGKPYRLPASGRYVLAVSGGTEEDAAYALTLAIR